MQASHPQRSSEADLLKYYSSVRSYTEKLCEPLETEDYIPQPIVDVSPPKWNIAHTTWFFEEMILKKKVSGYKVFDENFGFLFNSYYNSVGDRTARDHRGDLSRPTVKRVFEYRKYVDEQMHELLSSPAPGDAMQKPAREQGRYAQHQATTAFGNQSEQYELPDIALAHAQASAPQPPATAGGTDIRDLVILGINHEQQHQELFLTDFKYTLNTNPLFPAYRKNYAPEELSEPPASAMQKPAREQGRYAQHRATTAFGNQSAQHELPDIAPAHARASAPQPPAEAGGTDFAAGIYEIGYDGDGFCFDNELARHKVYLNDFEIANRLVTNAEFIEFIDDGGYSDHRLWHSEGWDWVRQNEIASPLYWHLQDGHWHHFTLGGLRALPMNAPVCHVSFYEAAAFSEWKGARLPTEFEWEAANAKFDWGLRWEWTGSAYLPYPGFKKPAGAVGEYNGKFMINQMVLRGASVATPEGHSRPTYRNFFHPHLRWQFTGIRLCR